MKSTFISSVQLLTLIFLVACASKNREFGPGENQQTQNSKEPQVTADYRFTNDGCETGYHQFEAKTNEELDQQLCSKLRDHRANLFCAKESRRNLFDRRCGSTGLQWVEATYEVPASGVKVPPIVPVTSHFPGKKWIAQVKNTVQLALAESVYQRKDRPEEVQELSDTFVEGFLNCGLNTSGPLCDLEEQTKVIWERALISTDRKATLVVEVENKAWSHLVLLVFEVIETKESLQVAAVTAYAELIPRQKDTVLNTYLADARNVSEIASAKISPSFIYASKKQILGAKKSDHVHYLFKNTASYYSKMPSATASRTNYLNELSKKADLLVEGLTLETMQEYDSWIQLFKADDKAGSLVFAALSAAQDPEVAQYAATRALGMDSEAEVNRELVRVAFHHSLPEIRLAAVEAIGGSNPSREEELEIIELLGSEEQALVQRAGTVAAFFNLSNDHLPAIAKLAIHERAGTRIGALVLGQSIKSAQSIVIQLNAIADQDDKVSQTAHEGILQMSRWLAGKHIERLVQAFTSKSTNVRIRVATIFERFKDKEAVVDAQIALLNQLDQEQDESVKAAINRSVEALEQ